MTDPPSETKKDEVNRVTIKIPPFWMDSPEIWFAQIEAQFTITQIKTDLSKFNTVVAHIESNVLSQVSEAILNPPEENKYENLKKQIIDRFADSEQRKMRKLLSDVSLGDQKPSNLLNEMRRLGGSSITDSFLKTLWLQNLPQQVRAILSTSEADLTVLATLADKIIEVGDFHNVHAITNDSASSSCSPSEKRIASLEKRIEQLTKTIERCKFSNRSRSRSRNSSQQRDATPKPKKKYEFCWYHFKFGTAATKCQQPCNFETKTKN